MFARMTHLLGDASVTLKLVLGFSLVLALSLVIAVTGWQALAASLYRSQTLTIIAQLAVTGEELRADRIVYRTLDDNNSLNKLSVSMGKVDELLVALSGRLKMPKPIEYLQEMTRISASFKTTLKDVPLLVEKREGAREQLKQAHRVPATSWRNWPATCLTRRTQKPWMPSKTCARPSSRPKIARKAQRGPPVRWRPTRRRTVTQSAAWKPPRPPWRNYRWTATC